MEASKSSQETPAPAEVADAELADATSQLGLAASSRFEFEASKGNDGTKILLVEWDTAPARRESEAAPVDDEAEEGENSGAGWEISWQGKTATFPTRDRDAGTRKRVYFLLPPGAPVPSLVTITHPTGSKLTTKPLPAIFPAELGSDSGTRGVLLSDTIWAKKRLSEIEEEVAREMRANGEGIGLEMALKEKQWLVDHFGLGPAQEATAVTAQSPVPLPGPMSPKSPMAGKLGEKLKGLKLATSPSELTAAAAAKNRAAVPNATMSLRSLSAKSADIAVSSYSALSDRKPQSDGGGAGVAASMASVLDGSNGNAMVSDADNEDDLFALPMSPRSPEMKRSPFSLL